MVDWYEPDEDTYTLIDVLKEEKLENKVIVDLGTSTGIITESLKKRNTLISVDLNIKALYNHRGGNLVRADLLCSIDQDSVDLIVFNPPYVPDTDDPIIGGGPHGREVIDKFINIVSAKTFYLLVIEANNPREIVNVLRARGYEVEILKRRKILGETIYIIRGISSK